MSAYIRTETLEDGDRDGSTYWFARFVGCRSCVGGMQNRHHLADLSADQHGSFTAAQARAAGLTELQLRRGIRAGEFERTGSNTFRSRFVERTTLGDLASFVLDCGAGAVVSGPTAAALHEFDGISLRPPFHVTVPRGRHPDRAIHCVHTSLDLPGEDETLRVGLATMTPVRTIIDLARFVRADTLTAALDGALRDQKLTEGRLHARIAAFRSRGRYGIPKLLDVIEGIEATRGGHSWLERRFLQICADGGLPRPVTQRVLTSAKGRKVRVDFAFPPHPGGHRGAGLSLAPRIARPALARQRAHQCPRDGRLRPAPIHL